MSTIPISRLEVFLLIALSLMISGCTTLVNDGPTITEDKMAHCSGSESVDDSSIAVLPIPVVAFFTPHADLNEIKADDYLRKCGEPGKLVNRKVEVNKVGCVPAGLTRIITLGIWQWCPASVSYEADVKSN
jgi:hypothetical protein